MKTTIKELQNRNSYLESQIEAIYLAGTVEQNRELIHTLNDEIKRKMITQRVSNSRPPACISARFQEGVFVFLNMRQISSV